MQISQIFLMFLQLFLSPPLPQSQFYLALQPRQHISKFILAEVDIKINDTTFYVDLSERLSSGTPPRSAW